MIGGRLTIPSLCVLCLLGCGGGSHDPGFQPIEGLTGKLAYITTSERNGYIEYRLAVLDLETGAIQTIYTAPPRDQIWSVSWHPGGQLLAIRTHTPNVEADADRLVRVNADGSGAFQVYNGTGPEFGGAYSPLGALAYCAGFSTDPLHGVFINGASAWPSDCYPNASPAWLPDGSGLTVAAFVGGVFGLYEVNLGSGAVTPLLTAPSINGLSSPAVSPAGDVVAVTAADAGGWSIRMVRLDGSGSAVLPGSNDAYDPQWSPDASHIVFQRGFRPYFQDLATGSVTRIIDVPTMYVAWYP